MPSINDRIGSQNVIRVLSNASAPPTKLLDLTDVNSVLRDDGLILIWDATSETFVMSNNIDNNIIISDNTPSNSTAQGALVVTGGVGIGNNLNVGGSGIITGTLTVGSSSVIIDGDNDVVTVGSGVTISSIDGISAPSIKIDGSLSGQSLYVSGISTLAGASGITTTGGDFYSGRDAFVKRNLKVEGTSEFIGQATFRGGTINLGDQNTDDINVVGEFISNLVPDVDNTNDLGTATQRWRNVYVSGLTTTNTLYVSSASTFDDELNTDSIKVRNLTKDRIAIAATDGKLEDTANLTFNGSSLSVTGLVTVTEGLYYDSDDFNGPNGIAFFSALGKLTSSTSTDSAATDTYYVLTTNSSGTPQWSSVIDGGEY